jgi:hypothetical protein
MIEPKFIIRIIPSYDNAAGITKAKAELAEINRQLLPENFDLANPPYMGWEWRKLMRTNLEREKIRAEQHLQAAKNRKSRTAKVEFCCINFFEIKDQLRARGYSFNREARSLDLFGAKCQAGWILELPPDRAINEFNWIAYESGWKFEVEGDCERALQALALGKPEIL